MHISMTGRRALSQQILGWCFNINIFSGEYIQTFDVCYASKVAWSFNFYIYPLYIVSGNHNKFI